MREGGRRESEMGCLCLDVTFSAGGGGLKGNNGGKDRGTMARGEREGRRGGREGEEKYKNTGEVRLKSGNVFQALRAVAVAAAAAKHRGGRGRGRGSGNRDQAAGEEAQTQVRSHRRRRKRKSGRRTPRLTEERK